MELVSTRDPKDVVTFAEAVGRSVPPGGGLYLPSRLAPFPDVDDLLAAGFAERSTEILARLLADEFARDAVANVVRAAFDFPVPFERVSDTIGVLELFHGPSLAFKDFGARFLAQVLARLVPSEGPRTILTATSGDTGAAVAHAFHGVPGFRAVVLYPRGLVSGLQERQFATLGGNVTALAVEGTFDECQALVKRCFADRALSRRAGLTSANSINIARLLAQLTYYFEAVAALRAAGRDGPAVIAVPSGNFGNLCAGVMALRLGLDVAALVAASNVNRTVPEYLDTGVYRARPSVATLSNAMDVGAPNNWERIEALFGNDIEAMRRDLRWGSRTDDETVLALRALAARGYRADPHAAVAYSVLAERLRPGETGVFLGTAHPAKFSEMLERTLGIAVELPPALAEAAARPLRARPLADDVDALREVLLEGVP